MVVVILTVYRKVLCSSAKAHLHAFNYSHTSAFMHLLAEYTQSTGIYNEYYNCVNWKLSLQANGVKPATLKFCFTYLIFRVTKWDSFMGMLMKFVTVVSSLHAFMPADKAQSGWKCLVCWLEKFDAIVLQNFPKQYPNTAMLCYIFYCFLQLIWSSVAAKFSSHQRRHF